MTGSIALKAPVNRFAGSKLALGQNKKQKADKKKNRGVSGQRYFCLPDSDELTLTELQLIMQYRFFRG